MLMGMAKPQSKEDEIFSHLHEVVLLNVGHEGPLHDDFFRAARNLHLSKGQCQMLREYASPSVKKTLNGNPSALWHAFSDYLKKRIIVSPAYSHVKQDELLKDVVIYSQWNIDNYGMILGLCLPSETRPYPAQKQDIQTFGDLLSYMQHSLLPEIKTHLAAKEGLSLDALEDDLAKKSSGYIEDRALGIDILMPIPQRVWKPEELTF